MANIRGVVTMYVHWKDVRNAGAGDGNVYENYEYAQTLCRIGEKIKKEVVVWTDCYCSVTSACM